MTWRLSRVLVPKLIWNQEIYGRLLLDSVNSEIRWLDAGCGHRVLPSGLESLEDSVVAKTKLVVGVDVDFDSLRRHRSFHLTACSSLDSLPFNSESFDLITCNMVVEHLEDPAAVFREFQRVLSGGGLLVIHTPNVLSYVVVISRVAKALLPSRAYLSLVHLSEARAAEDVFPAFYRANTRGQLKRLLLEAGFSETTYQTLVSPRPICNFFAPIGVIELMAMRATMSRPLRRFGSTILATYQKPIRIENPGDFQSVPVMKNTKEEDR